MNSRSKKGAILVIIGGFCWGLIGLFTRNLSARGLDSVQITLIRNVLAMIEMFVVIVIMDRKMLRIHLKDIWMFVGTGVCSVSFFNICYFKTIEMTTMSVAAILLYTAPCMVLIMSCIFLKEKITKQKVGALVLAFIGCVFTTGVLGESKNISNIGILIGLGSGFGYALYSIFGSFALRKYHTMTVTFYTFVMATIGLMPFGNPGFVVEKLTEDMGGLICAILLGVIATIIPYLCYTEGLNYIEAGKASVMAFVEPLVATICGIVVFREKLTTTTGIGIVLIFLSVVLLNMTFKIRQKK